MQIDSVRKGASPHRFAADVVQWISDGSLVRPLVRRIPSSTLITTVNHFDRLRMRCSTIVSMCSASQRLPQVFGRIAGTRDLHRSGSQLGQHRSVVREECANI